MGHPRHRIVGVERQFFSTQALDMERVESGRLQLQPHQNICKTKFLPDGGDSDRSYPRRVRRFTGVVILFSYSWIPCNKFSNVQSNWELLNEYEMRFDLFSSSGDLR